MIFKDVKFIIETIPIDIEITDEELNEMKSKGIDITNPDEVLGCYSHIKVPEILDIRDFEYENVEGLKHE